MFLLFTSAGDRSILLNKIWDLYPNPLFDIMVCFYGDNETNKNILKEKSTYFYERKGGKFQNLVWIYQNYKNINLNGKISIGNNVFIGINSTILLGVSISDNCIVAANSVVTKSVPKNSIVAGNPAKVVKYRFTEEQIEKLLSISWWNWDEQKIKDNAMLMWSDNINNFINKFI